MDNKDNQHVREVNRSFWEEHYTSGDFQYVSEHIFLTRGIGKGYDTQFRSGDPFQIRNLHLAYFVRGGIDNTVNLIRRHYTANQLMVATPDSILSQERRSDDFDMQVLQLSPDYVAELLNGNVPPAFANHMSEFTLTLCEEDSSAYLGLTAGLWRLIHARTKAPAAINACCTAILRFVHELTLSRVKVQNTEGSRNIVIFNRFIALVNERCDERRDMPFYADAIGLTKQHLSSIITATSGRTASSWIAEAILSRIKILLRHSDLTSAEISDRLNFSAPSHFARFFKHMTGMTPQEYKVTAK